MDNIPWVEKYRPSIINDIILDKYNEIIFKNIIKNKVFPNLLFYGPPGTGKTTTIINIIEQFNKDKINSKSLVIHLNASDDRGIDIIRNQIYQFSISNSLFSNGLKIVILDEIDYMTNTAQQALKYLMQSSSKIVFCLICNYISKINKSIQNECLHFKFNKLPETKINMFLNKINIAENLKLTNDNLIYIQNKFNSDIRSMINYMQSNQYNNNYYSYIKNNSNDILIDTIITKGKKEIILVMTDIIKYNNINFKNFIIVFINYIINHKKQYITSEFLKTFEFIVHLDETLYYNNLINYFVDNIKKFIY
jgi:DNA polymerase III delta prime subunit